MAHSRGGLLSLFALLAAMLLGAPDPLRAQDGAFAQDYVVVAIRRASDVAGGTVDPSLGDISLGDRISLGKRLRWLWDKDCDEWSVETLDEPVVWQDDPLLSDTQIPPPTGDSAAPDHRRNLHQALFCAGRPIGRFLRVDGRVLVAPSPSGMTNIILERPLSNRDVAQLQWQLKSRTIYDGPISGILDAATRRSVAICARRLGAAYAFENGAITTNLLDSLGIVTALPAQPDTEKAAGKAAIEELEIV